MSKWLAQIQARKNVSSGDRVDIVNCNATVSTMSHRTECGYEKKSISEVIKKSTLNNLITQLIEIYGGGEDEWVELAADNLDEAIKCFELLVEENQSVLNRTKQENVLV